MYKLSYYEHILHGTDEFPVAYYAVDRHHARYDMPLHWHKEWELIRICSGSLSLSADGVRYEGNAGDCFLLTGGVLHSGIPKSCVYECLVFDLHACYHDIPMVKKYLRPLYRELLLPPLFFSSQTPEASIAADLTAAARSSCPELSVLGELSRLLARLLETGCCTPVPQTKNTDLRRTAPLKAVLEYIEDHYTEDLTLEILSRVAGMNAKYFCRYFSSFTNRTPISYLNSYRIDQAALLLDDERISVTEAGLACGFDDTSYFIKCFRKYRGITPGQYRRLVAENMSAQSDAAHPII